MKTPITYYGGKQTLIKYLLPLIPVHRIYCEPFFGGGALLFAKPPSEVEIINDKNSEVVNFFRVVKTKFALLQKEIRASLHSRKLYKDAMVVYNNPDLFDEVKRAWAFWVATNQGFASMIGSWGFGKDDSKESALANKREAFTKEYADRLNKVQVEHNDALKVIDRADSPETFFYIDPPYIDSNQGHYSGYTETDFEALLSRLSKIKGKFLLSSYPSTLLNSFVKKFKWTIQKVSKAIAVTKLTDKKKIECMVMNYDQPAQPLIVKTDENKIKKKMKNHTALSGADDYNPTKEIHFIERFLLFHNKRIYKNTMKLFIEDLQYEVKEENIRKHSPYAKQIIRIQQSAIEFYEKPDFVNHLVLSEDFRKFLNDAILDYENKIDRPGEIDPIEPVDLSGVERETNGEILSSMEFEKMEFPAIGFTEKWLELIGDPSPGFTAMVYGKPKMGKSFLCVDFAGYLARNFGKVLYVAKEEKLNRTLQEKLKQKDVAHVNLFVSDHLPEDLSEYDFIFLDSVNLLGLSPEEIRNLKEKNSGKSFVFVFQTTKTGKFRGANSFQHDVDIVVEIPEKGKAVQFGRFNQGGEMLIFSDIDTTSEELSGTKPKPKYPAWTTPKHLKEWDHNKLKHIYDLYKKGELEDAYNYAMYNADTMIRDEIAGDVWLEIGGQITRYGMDKLRKTKGDAFVRKWAHKVLGGYSISKDSGNLEGKKIKTKSGSETKVTKNSLLSLKDKIVSIRDRRKQWLKIKETKDASFLQETIDLCLAEGRYGQPQYNRFSAMRKDSFTGIGGFDLYVLAEHLRVVVTTDNKTKARKLVREKLASGVEILNWEKGISFFIRTAAEFKTFKNWIKLGRVAK